MRSSTASTMNLVVFDFAVVYLVFTENSGYAHAANATKIGPEHARTIFMMGDGQRKSGSALETCA